ncbi:MAG TPA: ABC transporter substrate-binding protein [Acidimicrobiales bacterium]|nr:ABC transporter substrate-binding protein [Acidimicrobiales bacterium]
MRVRTMLVVAAAAVTVVAACSSSTKKPATTTVPATTAGGPATSAATATSAAMATSAAANGALPTVAPLPPVTGNTTTGVTATQVKLGALIYKAFYADVVNGFNARLKRENDAGGVYGRKIVVDTVADDNQTADQDLAAAKTLVQQDNVFAVAPVMTAALGGATFLETSKVPFFGWSIEPRWCGLNWGFGFQGNDCDQSTQKRALDIPVAQAKLFPDGDPKGKTIAVTSEDNDSARAAANGAAKTWEAAGAKVVLVDTSIPSPPAVVGDFTPFAQKVMTSNNGGPPDYVEMVNSVSDTIGLFKKLSQLGYKGVAQGFTNYDPRLLGQTKGLSSEVGFAPYEDAASVPVVQQMITDLKAFQSNIVLSQPAAAGYWIADFFIQALKKAGPNLTREALYNAINGGFTYDNHGGTTPVQWPLAHTFSQAGFSFVTDAGDHFDVPVHLTAVPIIPNPAYKG